MNDLQRDRILDELRGHDRYDLIVIGGGATGAGIALDAASRGYRVALLEREDFGSGTSSKSSKLVHGGVRYLANAEFSLVREALRERSILLNNAPHLVNPLSFIIPAKNIYEHIKYRAGLWLYDRLASDRQFAPSRAMDLSELRATLRTLRSDAFTGAVKYSDGLFDDTRLLWDIVNKAANHGATVVNYCQVVGLIKQGGRVSGVEVLDKESGDSFSLHADAVINATGAWSDEIGALDSEYDEQTVVPSQGTHIVISRDFFPSDDGLLIPRTKDGRVMFVIPWHGKVVIGTTDEKLPAGTTNAVPKEQEIDLILATASDYLQAPPTRRDINACFAGIRPLSAAGAGAKTAKISREHAIEVSHSGLLTISGGKWTTYRLMAEQCVDTFEKLTEKPHRPCATTTLKLGGDANTDDFGQFGGNRDAFTAFMQDNPAYASALSPELELTTGEVIFAVRYEMARTLMDVLARRTRSLFLNANATSNVAPRVAELMRNELDQGVDWQESQLQEFAQQAASFTVS